MFFLVAQAGEQTWDLLTFVYFLSHNQCLRPLGYYVLLIVLMLFFEIFSSSIIWTIRQRGIHLGAQRYVFEYVKRP